MAKLFLDTDVCFDIISVREPFFEHSFAIYEYRIQKDHKIIISGGSVSNLVYLALERYMLSNANENLIDFIISCEVWNAKKSIILTALKSPFKDKEDAIQYYTALDADVDYFITRNIKDYVHAKEELKVFSPADFLGQVN